MLKKFNFVKPTIYLVILLTGFVVSFAQDAKKDSKAETEKPAPVGKPVMWEPGEVASRDLYWGPGGEAMKPDTSKIEFIEEEKKGASKKYRIKDGAGKVWVAKIGREAQPETAAVRLLWALGYKTEINYLVPKLTIPGKGTFENVRLEARPDEVDRLDEWKWKENPFLGTKEYQGLKMMMVFFNNWDIVDVQNKILQADGADGTRGSATSGGGGSLASMRCCGKSRCVGTVLGSGGAIEGGGCEAFRPASGSARVGTPE